MSLPLPCVRVRRTRSGSRSSHIQSGHRGRGRAWLTRAALDTTCWYGRPVGRPALNRASLAESCARAIFVGGLVAPWPWSRASAESRRQVVDGRRSRRDGIFVTLPVVWYGLTREDRASLAHNVRHSCRVGPGWGCPPRARHSRRATPDQQDGRLRRPQYQSDRPDLQPRSRVAGDSDPAGQRAGARRRARDRRGRRRIHAAGEKAVGALVSTAMRPGGLRGCVRPTRGRGRSQTRASRRAAESSSSSSPTTCWSRRTSCARTWPPIGLARER